MSLALLQFSLEPSVILLHIFPNVPNVYELFSQLDIKFLESEDHSKGRMGGSEGWASDFSSGHDLAACGFEPRVGLSANGLEPGACFGFCVCVSLSLFLPARALSLKNKDLKH